MESLQAPVWINPQIIALRFISIQVNNLKLLSRRCLFFTTHHPNHDFPHSLIWTESWPVPSLSHGPDDVAMTTPPGSLGLCHHFTIRVWAHDSQLENYLFFMFEWLNRYKFAPGSTTRMLFHLETWKLIWILTFVSACILTRFESWAHKSFVKRDHSWLLQQPVGPPHLSCSMCSDSQPLQSGFRLLL